MRQSIWRDLASRYSAWLPFLLLYGVVACTNSGQPGANRESAVELIIEPPTHPVLAPASKVKATAITAKGQNETRVLLIMKTLTNPFFAIMEKGARKAADEYGVKLIVKAGASEESTALQRRILEQAIDDEIDAIVITPATSIDLIPALKRIQAAGIPIINVDNRFDADALQDAGVEPIPFVGVNNHEGAYRVASYLAAHVSQPAQAVILEGISNVRTSIDRRHGALRGFGEHEHVTVVATKSANWNIREAHQVTQNLLTAYPKLKLIFCANDLMALGAARYLDEIGRHDVLIGGYDNLDEAQQAIRAGKLLLTADQQADQQGYLGVKLAVDALTKGATSAGTATAAKVPIETLIDVKLVTMEALK